MSQQEKWLRQRIALVRRQLQEWKDIALQEAQVRKVLIDNYNEAKALLFGKPDGLMWAKIRTKYAEELTWLTGENEQKRAELKKRQQRESAELEELIKREQLREM